MAREPCLDLGVFMGGVVVQNDMDDLAGRDVPLDPIEEADKLLMAVTGHVLADHRAFQDVQRGEQRGGSVALVIVGQRRAPALLQRQARLGAVQGLDLALLVDAKHDGMGRRRNVKAHDIGQFLDEGGIIREFELAPTMRRQAMGLPDRLHG